MGTVNLSNSVRTSPEARSCAALLAGAGHHRPSPHAAAARISLGAQLQRLQRYGVFGRHRPREVAVPDIRCKKLQKLAGSFPASDHAVESRTKLDPFGGVAG